MITSIRPRATWRGRGGLARSQRLRVRGRARSGTFRERVDPCQHCGSRRGGRMRTASASTFRVGRALSLPPAARFRAFYRHHAAARSKAAAAGSRGSRARCIHRRARAQSWVLPVKRPSYPWRPVVTLARAEALLDRVLLIPFPRTVPDRYARPFEAPPRRCARRRDHTGRSRRPAGHGHERAATVIQPMPSAAC